MIRLTETLLYVKSLPFEQQEQDVQDFVRAKYYELALLDPPAELTEIAINNGGMANAEHTISNENCATTFDLFVRPIHIVVSIDDYCIIGERIYQDASNAWKLHAEILTVNTSTL